MRTLTLLLLIIPLLAAAQENSTQSITIKRGACFGECPIYSMTVFADGTYFWQGEEYVAKKGYSYGKMKVSKFEQALRVLTSAKYQTFRKTYSSDEDGCKVIATDNPSVQLIVQTPSSLKEIYHYCGCSGFAREAELENLEKKIDEIFETNKFIDLGQSKN